MTASTPADPADLAATVADEVHALLGSGRQTAPFSSRHAAFDLATAYRAAASVRDRRARRGDRRIGRKIGFTNRTIWPEYGVWHPIWGDVWDTTAQDLPATGDAFALAGLAEPRIEPEIVLHLAAAPAAGMDEAALLGCIDWVAHGFEIVQSLFPGWRFAAADTVAAFGLHGALLIGPRHDVAADRGRWLDALAAFEIDLLRDGAVVDTGRAANVLDGPLSALRHLVELLDADASQPPLAAGEIVSTGTLTRAMPVAAGEVWRTALRGIDIGGIEVRFG